MAEYIDDQVKAAVDEIRAHADFRRRQREAKQKLPSLAGEAQYLRYLIELKEWENARAQLQVIKQALDEAGV